MGLLKPSNIFLLLSLLVIYTSATTLSSTNQFNFTQTFQPVRSLSQPNEDPSVINPYFVIVGRVGVVPAVVVYDDASATWKEYTANVPRANFVDGVAIVNNTVIFAGWYNRTTEWTRSFSHDVDIFHLSTKTWSTHTLSQNRTNIQVAVHNHLVFLIGGVTYSSVSVHPVPSKRVDLYNARLGEWHSSPLALSAARVELQLVSLGDESIAFVSGRDADSALVSTVDIFHTSTLSFTETSLPTVRRGFTLVGHDNCLFVAGGVSPAAPFYVSSIEIYHATSHSWTTHHQTDDTEDDDNDDNERLVMTDATHGSNYVVFHYYRNDDRSDTAAIHIFLENSTTIWANVSSLPAISATSHVAVGNVVLWAGGLTQDGQPSNHVSLYNTQNFTWDHNSYHLSVARVVGVNAVIPGTAAVFAGGFAGESAAISSDAVDIYYLTTNTWRSVKLSVKPVSITAFVSGDSVVFVEQLYNHLAMIDALVIPTGEIAAAQSWSAHVTHVARTLDTLYVLGEQSGLGYSGVDTFNTTTLVWNRLSLNASSAEHPIHVFALNQTLAVVRQTEHSVFAADVWTHVAHHDHEESTSSSEVPATTAPNPGKYDLSVGRVILGLFTGAILIAVGLGIAVVVFKVIGRQDQGFTQLRGAGSA